MKIIHWENLNTSSFSYSDFKCGTSVTIGSFDGPHKGHKLLIENVLNNATKNELKSCIVTFTRPLPFYKYKDDYSGDISTLEERLNFFEKIGIDFCILIDFSSDFKKLSGNNFLQILKDKLNLKYICEGKDFHFGFMGKNTILDIQDFCVSNKIDFNFVDLVLEDSSRVSSSKIRKLINEKKIEQAKKLLWNQDILKIQ